MFTVQAYDHNSELIDDEDCESLDDCYAVVDQFVADGAASVEVVNGRGDIVWESD